MGHRQLAQHQHDAVQLPPSRDVRVGVGVLGRWRLQRQLRRRPDASVEVHGELNTNTNSNSNGNSYAYTDSYAYVDAYGPAETKPDTKVASHAAA